MNKIHSLRVTLQMRWRWSPYPEDSCSQCQTPAGDGALAELYMPLPTATTYASEAEAFQAADDVYQALSDQQEQGAFTRYGRQIYCRACAEQALTDDLGPASGQIIAQLRQAPPSGFWLATFLMYEPGAYGRYQPFFLYGTGPASVAFIYERACQHSARYGIREKPSIELDRFRMDTQNQMRGAKARHRRGQHRTARVQQRQAAHAQSSRSIDIDDRGRAHLRTEPSPQQCEECGRPGPNKKWTVLGNSGVLCTRCLSLWIEEVNTSLGAKGTAPSENYEPQSGDIYLQELRPGQWNLHRYIDGLWEYQTILSQGDAEHFVTLMRLVGETNEEPFGRRRYYRPLQA